MATWRERKPRRSSRWTMGEHRAGKWWSRVEGLGGTDPAAAEGVTVEVPAIEVQ